MKRAWLFSSLILIIVLSACGAPAIPATPAPTDTPAAPTAVPATATQAVPPTPTEVPPTPTLAGPCTDAASFVADVTVPDYSHFDQKQAFTKTWRIKNVGTCTWTADYKVVYSSGDALGAPSSIALTETAPGTTVDITANMAAPARDGKFEILYTVNNADDNPIPIDAGNTLWTLITVGKYTAVAPVTPTAGASTVSTGSTGTSGAGLTTPGCVPQTNATIVSQILALVNAARALNSQPPLTINDKLTAAAQSHSADMACNSYLNHTGWNGSTPDSRIAATGYAASIVRENIFAQPPQYGGTAQAAVDWWLTNDLVHRDALLNPQVTEIGIGYAAYSRSELGGYFTIDLAAP